MFVKSSQLKQQVNLLRLLRRRFQLQQDAKVDILQNEFSKQFCIAVNDELGAVEESLEQAIDLLAKMAESV